MPDNGIIVAVDASRNRSGGALAHLIGLLGSVDPRDYGINEVHLWSYPRLLSQIPDQSWLVKHCPRQLQQSLPQQVWWQYSRLAKEVVQAGCNILLSTDAGSVCRFLPNVVMSRDMLSFEPKEISRYGAFSVSRLRLYLLKHVQISSLRKSSGAIFLTQYASDVISRHTGTLKSSAIIPHGVGKNFRAKPCHQDWPSFGSAIQCIYVSNADLYKHQWHVISAISNLRKAGYNISLTLAGAGSGQAVHRVIEQADICDPTREYVHILPKITHDEVAHHIHKSNIFIFASSCENMPNTLLEGMAAGLPIACSNRGPMPEILKNGGVYFDPESPTSIAKALSSIITQNTLRVSIQTSAFRRSLLFSWERCAIETWQYLRATASCQQIPIRQYANDEDE